MLLKWLFNCRTLRWNYCLTLYWICFVIRLAKIKRRAEGLERGEHRSQKHSLLMQRTQLWVPAPTQLTTTYVGPANQHPPSSGLQDTACTCAQTQCRQEDTYTHQCRPGTGRIKAWAMTLGITVTPYSERPTQMSTDSIYTHTHEPSLCFPRWGGKLRVCHDITWAVSIVCCWVGGVHRQGLVQIHSPRGFRPCMKSSVWMN